MAGSDLLQVGSTTFPPLTETGSIESVTTPAVTINPVAINDLQPIVGTRTILLTEPGSTSISDIVTATITCTGMLGENGTACPPPGQFQLSVTLTSDGETPLTPPVLPAGTFTSLPETGGPQTLDFASLFNVTSTSLPAIVVTSDGDATGVPEPTSLALLGSALAGLAFVRRRRKS